jgi:tRNA (guanosine-2'-O-)-methyltransferase
MKEVSDREERQALYQFLAGFITEERKSRLEKTASDRTRHFTVVLENIFQPHNASAVLRTCECFGVQDVHVIENSNKFEVIKDISLGSSSWLTIHRYQEQEHNTEACYRNLRKTGYQIIGTSPHSGGITLEELELDARTALVIGSEKEGLSQYGLEHADQLMHVNMQGLTESLNLSVFAAICIHSVVLKLRRESPRLWGLSESDRLELLIGWVKKSVTNGEILEREFYRKKGKG